MKTKRLILLSYLFLLSTVLSSQSKDNLPAGTVIPIYFTHYVCSDGNNQIRAYVSKDIYGDSGKIVVRGGESVAIEINKKKARGWGRPGSIEVIAISVTGVDGTEIKLNGSDYVEGRDKKSGAILSAVGGFFLIPFFGILAGALVKGEDVCISGIPVVRTVNTVTIKSQ